MTRYLKFVVPALILAVVLVIMMVNLSSALVYFNSPSEVATRYSMSQICCSRPMTKYSW